MKYESTDECFVCDLCHEIIYDVPFWEYNNVAYCRECVEFMNDTKDWNTNTTEE